MKKRVLLSTMILAGLLAVSGCGKEKDAEAVQPETEIQESQENTAAEDTEGTVEEGTVEEGTKRIMPLPQTITLENLNNCTVAVSFEEGDAYVDDSGIMQLEVTVYGYDVYDMVDIAQMEEGDTIYIHQEDVVIESLERLDTGLIYVNGGLDNGGFDLYTEESGVYFESGYNDAKNYYELGKTKLPVSEDFRFYDSSDLEQGEQNYYPGDFLTEDSGIAYYFNPNNTSIVIEDGKVIEMYRIYTP